MDRVLLSKKLSGFYRSIFGDEQMPSDQFINNVIDNTYRLCGKSIDDLLWEAGRAYPPEKHGFERHYEEVAIRIGCVSSASWYRCNL